MTEHEWLGRWKRPNGAASVGGKLEVGDTGVSLLLLGSLADWGATDLSAGIGFPLREPQRIPVVHGRTDRSMTVLNASCDFPIPPGAEGSESWHADAAIEGFVVAPPDGLEPRFGGIRFELDLLPGWARARGVAGRYFTDGRTEVSVQPHDLGRAVLADGTIVHIDQGSITSSGHLHFEIRQPVTFVVDCAEQATWHELLNQWLQPVQALLWIVSGASGRVQTIELRLPADDEHQRERWGRLWVSLVEPAPAGTRRPSEREMLFLANEMPGGFGSGLQRWLGLWGDLRHVLGPLYARASAPFAYANDRFYTAAAALEAYHRYCSTSERDLPLVEHGIRVDRVAAVLTEHAPDLCDWAVNAVRPFNRIPYWRRITEMVDCFPLLRDELFGEGLVPFSKAVEDARHGHAHALERSRTLDDGASLYVAADVLVWLLRACILVDLGFAPDDVESRIRRHEGLHWVSERMRSLLREL